VVIDNGVLPGMGIMEDRLPSSATQCPGCDAGFPINPFHSPPARGMPSCFGFACVPLVSSLAKRGKSSGPKAACNAGCPGFGDDCGEPTPSTAAGLELSHPPPHRDIETRLGMPGPLVFIYFRPPRSPPSR
jgi:hypothetical protein